MKTYQIFSKSEKITVQMKSLYALLHVSKVSSTVNTGNKAIDETVKSVSASFPTQLSPFPSVLEPNCVSNNIIL